AGKDRILMDLTSAYDEPSLKSLTREFVYTRGASQALTVSDKVSFGSPQKFETPIITRSEWKQVSDRELELTREGEKIRVRIDSPGNPYTIESEEIAEEGGVPYTRIAIRLKKPVQSAEVSVTYRVEN